jgi:glutamate 5-kinase
MTVVAKLGSSIVAADDGELRTDVLDRVCGQVAELHGKGENVTLVTSGAIARGIRVLELGRRLGIAAAGIPAMAPAVATASRAKATL